MRFDLSPLTSPPHLSPGFKGLLTTDRNRTAANVFESPERREGTRHGVFISEGKQNSVHTTSLCFSASFLFFFFFPTFFFSNKRFFGDEGQDEPVTINAARRRRPRRNAERAAATPVEHIPVIYRRRSVSQSKSQSVGQKASLQEEIIMKQSA